MNSERGVAYFSMEIGLETGIKTYSGGLGVLAGDTIRSAADLRMPMVAVSLLYRKRYFRQRLEADGEGHIEGLTGWAIGGEGRGEGESSSRSRDAAALYDKLERIIIPLFYHDRERFVDVMVHFIAINGSFFNTHRMVLEYVLNAYF